MKIWVVNDDGIDSNGIKALARHAAVFGDVTVIAPVDQCSGMSSYITLGLYGEPRTEDKFQKVPFGVEGIDAYAVKGTPTDCVIMAEHFLKEKPDFLFSGINRGENAGLDILYSGTIGAAMEALVSGIPAIAFSQKWEVTDFDLVDQEIDGIIKELLSRKLPANQIWNVNFPAFRPETFKGILWDCVPSQRRYNQTAEETNDVEKADRVALEQGYISIGTITNMALVP